MNENNISFAIIKELKQFEKVFLFNSTGEKMVIFVKFAFT